MLSYRSRRVEHATTVGVVAVTITLPERWSSIAWIRRSNMRARGLSNYKPVSVPGLSPGGSHSSRSSIAAGLKRPTRDFSCRLDPEGQADRRWCGGPPLVPYLVLLRVGFALPSRLLETRCALTAPFHPYPEETPGRYVFCGTFRGPPFESGPPAVSRHAALRRPDFPPRLKKARRLPVRQAQR